MLQTFTDYVPVEIKVEHTAENAKLNTSNLELIQKATLKRKLQFRYVHIKLYICYPLVLCDYLWVIL